jgi:hypothetical protein
VDDAGAVRAGNGEIVLAGEAAQLGVARAALGAGLGEAAGQDQQGAVAARSRLAHRIEDEVGADDDDGEVGRGRQLGERAADVEPEHGAAPRVDRDDLAGEARDAQILQHRAARRPRPLAGADDGDAARGEERGEVARHPLAPGLGSGR